MTGTLPHILRRVWRSLGENFFLNAVSSGVIGVALLLLGVYLSVQYNLNALMDTWQHDVHLSAYFAPGTTEAEREAVRQRLLTDPVVAEIRYVSEAEAQAWLAGQVEGVGPTLTALGTDVLPASLEISLKPEKASPEELAAWSKNLTGPPFTDVDYGQEWVERFGTFLSMLRIFGSALGLIILLAALFVVSNTVWLVVWSRRDELEIEKLVGATHNYITAPFLLEGLIQGLIGSGVAMGGLFIVHRTLGAHLGQALNGPLFQLTFLPPEWALLLGCAGLVLGGGGAVVAVQRFLSSSP
jgi:cell division transport system permease protein